MAFSTTEGAPAMIWKVRGTQLQTVNSGVSPKAVTLNYPATEGAVATELSKLQQILEYLKALTR